MKTITLTASQHYYLLAATSDLPSINAKLRENEAMIQRQSSPVGRNTTLNSISLSLEEIAALRKTIEGDDKQYGRKRRAAIIEKLND